MSTPTLPPMPPMFNFNSLATQLATLFGHLVAELWPVAIVIAIAWYGIILLKRAVAGSDIDTPEWHVERALETPEERDARLDLEEDWEKAEREDTKRTRKQWDTPAGYDHPKAQYYDAMEFDEVEGLD